MPTAARAVASAQATVCTRYSVRLAVRSIGYGWSDPTVHGSKSRADRALRRLARMAVSCSQV